MVALAFLAEPMLIIAALIRLTSRGPALSWSKRVGRSNRSFSMPKFRTMQVGTAEAPASRIGEPRKFLSGKDVSH